ncbi:SagB/ThcOx family dehydrogenase, partial [Nitratifractor sp.]
YHEATKHSWISVRRDAHALEWSTQPSPYKRYGDTLPRISLLGEDPIRAFLYRIGGITAKKSYPGVEYYLRTNPSAGALYPNEVYFQARGMEGLQDGIYHLEVASSSAVMLAPIGPGEGLEAFLEDSSRRRGLLFFVSGVYWRSSWKYRRRAFRYVLLDGGHLLGAMEASMWCEGASKYRVHYRIDTEGLNRFFGFGREEWMLSAFEAATKEGPAVSAPAPRLTQVDPTGTFEADEEIEAAYRESAQLAGCVLQERAASFPFNPKALRRAIVNRRSIRAFTPGSITAEEFERILEWARDPVPSDCDEPLKLYCVLNRVEGMPRGLWCDGKMLREGDFAEQAGYLCLEQALGSQSAVTIFMSSGGRNYRALYQKAGIIGQRLYLAAEMLGIGASGIGAYYDDEVREFLGTKEKILYALAIGR